MLWCIFKNYEPYEGRKSSLRFVRNIWRNRRTLQKKIAVRWKFLNRVRWFSANCQKTKNEVRFVRRFCFRFTRRQNFKWKIAKNNLIFTFRTFLRHELTHTDKLLCVAIMCCNFIQFWNIHFRFMQCNLFVDGAEYVGGPICT